MKTLKITSLGPLVIITSALFAIETKAAYGKQQVVLAQQQCSTFPLSTQGRYIVDGCGERFKLKSVNWFGASDEGDIPGGLRFQHRDFIARLIKEKGFNSVRLPFSNEMLYKTTPVDQWRVAENPDLVGRTPLEVFDAVVKSLTDQGIAVILNNHTTYSGWCCDFDYNGLWYNGGYTTENWIKDWEMLATRYKNNKGVVGVDLRNEVRTSKTLHYPNWGLGDQNDWRWAAERAGNAVGAVNPDLLVIVEGINWTGGTPAMGGWRLQLRDARANPVNLKVPHKLVYSAHNYSYTGPQHLGQDSWWLGNGKRYRDMSKDELRKILEDEFAFISELEQIYTAPIWLSEFGAAYYSADTEETWLSNLTDILIEKDYGFAWWPLNATRTQQDITLDDFGLLTQDWKQFRDDWRFKYINRLLSENGTTGLLPPVPDFRLVNFRTSDNNQSQTLGDWDAGALKGTCVDGMRAIGLGEYNNLLCSDIHYGSFEMQGHSTITSESLQHGYDWAEGLTKYECPLGSYVSGISSRSWGTSGVLCTAANQPLGNECQTLWFNEGDNRLSIKARDWAEGAYKSQAADDQYIAGIGQRRGNAQAILVCK